MIRLCRRIARRVAALVIVAGAALPVLAQEFRGEISGRVVDACGGVLPGVTVTATNGRHQHADQHGHQRDRRVQDAVPEPRALYPHGRTRRLQEARTDGRGGARRGPLEHRVEPVAGRPGGDGDRHGRDPAARDRRGSQGQVIDEKRISLLPLSDGNPFILARLAPGMAYTGDLKFSRPFDNAGTSNVVADGAPAANEFTLDGSPNMASGGRVAFVPPSDAVQEFKVESATFDAQQGHTAGATVNVAIKSGTNNFRGTGYFFYRDDSLSTNEYFLEKAGKPKSKMDYTRWAARWAARSSRTRRSSSASSSGSTTRSRSRTLFSVPTAAQRNGDFSALLVAGHHHLRPGHGVPNCRGPRRAPAVPGQRHPGQPPQPDRAELPEVLPDGQSGR